MIKPRRKAVRLRQEKPTQKKSGLGRITWTLLLLLGSMAMLALINLFQGHAFSMVDLSSQLKIIQNRLEATKKVLVPVLEPIILPKHKATVIPVESKVKDEIYKQLSSVMTSKDASNIQPLLAFSSISSLTSPPSLPRREAVKKPKKIKDRTKYPYEPDQPYIDYGYELHIRKIPGEKTGLRQDLRVVLSEMNYTSFTRPPGPPSGELGSPRAYTSVRHRLINHPLFNYLTNSSNHPLNLENTMLYIKTLPICDNKPVFLTLAAVGDDLYWQLIENFIYTMVKFDLVECAMVICVSDPNCLKLCHASDFPCYPFQSAVSPRPSVMEQIGELKLSYIPRALLLGVDVFMLDLDVGFLYSPMWLVEAFYATPHIDVFVQEDIIFVMNRSTIAWKSWSTQALPNIGLFLCRGNNRTARVFSIAWDLYQKMDDPDDKKNPGKDQNHVLEGMRYGRVKFGLRYAYFSNSTSVLLDKMCLYHNRSVELGGQAAYELLAEGRTLAAHMTCYEHSTKVLGLKATNAFWNPLYYDPLRPTLTKQIVFISEEQVLDEIRSLLWLGLSTQRAVIIPNLLGPDHMPSGGYFDGRKYWPGFRVAKIKREGGVSVLKVDILEPAFYWRVQRDYDEAPDPVIAPYEPNQSLDDIRHNLLSNYSSTPRLVIHWSQLETIRNMNNILKWANDSVGFTDGSYESILVDYQRLPSLKNIDKVIPMVSEVLGGMRTCYDVFGKLKGNRTCFQICD